MTYGLPSPSECPGSDDWNEDTGRRILNAEDRRIRELFPEFKRVAALPGQSIWEGLLQPFVKPYRVRMIWSLGVRGQTIRSTYSSPMVLVMDPPLVRRSTEPERPIPHLYARPRPDMPPHLCLYWPPGREFDASMYLAESILPWAAEWLMYYELWHVTGEWVGPEAPHGSAQPTPMAAPATEALPVSRRKRCQPAQGLLHAHPYLIATGHPVVPDSAEMLNDEPKQKAGHSGFVSSPSPAPDIPTCGQPQAA